MKNKTLRAISILFALIAGILSTVGVVLYYTTLATPGKTTHFYFTVNSNIFLAVVSFLYIIMSLIYLSKEKELPAWLCYLRLASVTAISVTLFTVIFFLAPLWALTPDNIKFCYEGCNLFMHVLAPLIAMIGFLFFDVTRKLSLKWAWTGFLPVLVYGIIYISFVLGTGNLTYDVYNFAHVGSETTINYGRAVAFIFIMFVGALVISYLWWLINNCFYKVFDNVEPKKETPVKPVKQRETDPNKFNGVARTYHISKDNTGSKWQVKLAKGEKAIKLFDTQQEAIEYAKGLVDTQGGSIRIHSLKGKIRK